ncbi:ArsR family transcriptional regulator [Candidatus Bathyarchaeota archaeon]|nr:ArsR family transcriptional regulator [Candidatus Bathyarchaeota archaeon]
MEEWGKDALDLELNELEFAIDQAVTIHYIFSNKVRAKMLSEIIKSTDRRFSELMNIIKVNQKIISENLKYMVENGLIKRVEKKPSEVHYIPSDIGFAGMLTCIMMRRILNELDEE